MVNDDIDARLESISAQLGYAGGAKGLRDLMAGVTAAPLSHDPLAWTDLAGADLSADRRQDLETLRRRLAARSAPVVVPMDERIGALRDELVRMGVDGFVVPRADAHQGEAVPAASERLAWLTGFTGSAGVGVILADSAAIFVDGRYTLQAAAQVDQDTVTCVALAEMRPEDWIAKMAPAGAVIGFDPWLHTVNQIDRLGAALTRSGISLRALDYNPIDSVWAGRPPAPIAPVRRHPVALAGRESHEKRREIGDAVAAAGADAAFLSAPDSIAWLLNIRGGDVPNTPVPLAFAAITVSGATTLFLDPRKIPFDLASWLSEEVTIRTPAEIDGHLSSWAGEGKRVMIDPDQVPVRFDTLLRQAGARVLLQADPCVHAKARKTAAELDGARSAHLRDGVAMSRFLAWIDRQDLTAAEVGEFAAAERLAAFRRETDTFLGPSFETISGAGPNGAIVHYRVESETSRRLTPGTLYLVDSGGQYSDGTTDVTRTVALGSPTSRMRRHYTLVLKGHIAVSTLRFPPGTTGGQIDVLARHALWMSGLDFDHGTGHGVGSCLSVHEGPQRIAKAGGAAVLAPGMIVSNEPGLYIPNDYGIRIENLIVVTEATEIGDDLSEDWDYRRPMHAFETLTLVPYDRRLIDCTLLTVAERHWVDAYHARVRQVLSPVLEDGGDRTWLDAATAPL